VQLGSSALLLRHLLLHLFKSPLFDRIKFPAHKSSPVISM
jgi:hypothetical protein